MQESASNAPAEVTVPAVEWRPVVGWEGLYEVSNIGQVRSVRTGLPLKSKLDKYGYPHLGLRGKDKRYWVTVHRLVAFAFISKPEGKDHIDHIDGNKQNNCVSNLRWVTPKENIHNPVTISHMRSTEYRVFRSQLQNAIKKRVCCVETGAVYESLHAAERATGISHTRIRRSCENIRSGKYLVTYRNNKKVLHWMYEEDRNYTPEFTF